MIVRFATTVILVLMCVGPAGRRSADLQASSLCDATDMRHALVGTWRGHAIYVGDRHSLYRVDAWFTFTSHGEVELYRGPLEHGDSASASAIRLRGSYEVVGQNVLIMLDQNTTTFTYTLTGLTITCERLEFISTSQLVVSRGDVTFILNSTGFTLGRE